MSSFPHVLVTGGAGYVGSVLVPCLLREGYRVTVVDLLLFGDDALSAHPRLTQLRGDIRDRQLLRDALKGVDAVIHLAGISNDPSVELDLALSREINYDSFEPLLRECQNAGVRRFIFASSASIYGISDQPNVKEDHPLVPVSQYNRLKAECEQVLFSFQSPSFSTVSVRPATLSGYSPRLRLDLAVNTLTAQAIEHGRITVFGGAQLRPCLHLRDMVDLYSLLLTAPRDRIDGQTFNIGCENLSIADVARTVREVVEQDLPSRAPIKIFTQPSDDPRSYHICSEKIRRTLGFVPRHTIRDAIRELIVAFRSGSVPNPSIQDRYYNVRLLKRVQPFLQRSEFAGQPLAG